MNFNKMGYGVIGARYELNSISTGRQAADIKQEILISLKYFTTAAEAANTDCIRDHERSFGCDGAI